MIYKKKIHSIKTSLPESGLYSIITKKQLIPLDSFSKYLMLIKKII
jgi:hypothetical protein